MDTFKLTNFMLFLSTLSLRRATTSSTVIVILRKNFYPRSPCGERQRANSLPHAPPQISIHALLAESDMGGYRQRLYPRRFLSTLSLRRATSFIHGACHLVPDFYPRSPCGERPTHQATFAAAEKFLSTLSLRRATQGLGGDTATAAISIHALLAESDARRASRQQPAGISIHALLAESDLTVFRSISTARYFYPRSPCGERRQSSAKSTPEDANFYPRSPCGERPWDRNGCDKN